MEWKFVFGEKEGDGGIFGRPSASERAIGFLFVGFVRFYFSRGFFFGEFQFWPTVNFSGELFFFVSLSVFFIPAQISGDCKRC